MTTRKHEIEEECESNSVHGCPHCMEREVETFCSLCAKMLCLHCLKGDLCPECAK